MFNYFYYLSILLETVGQKDTCEIKIKTILCVTFTVFADKPLYGVGHLHVADSVGHTLS